MNKTPMNAADLQNMIQKYRDEMMKANQKKTLSDEEQPLRTPDMPSAPVIPRKPAAKQEPAADIEPVDDIQTTAGVPFSRTFSDVPAEPTAESTASDPAPPADSPLVFPPSNVSGFYDPAAPLPNPEPTTYWTPPCMQANYNFPPDFPVQDYTFTQTNPSDVSVSTPTPYAAPIVFPYSTEATALKPAVLKPQQPDTASEETVVTISQLWPVQEDIQNDDAQETAAGENRDEPCEAPVCPSLYWPQTPETEVPAVQAMNRPPVTVMPETPREDSDFAPPPSLIRPSPDSLPPQEERESGQTMPSAQAQPQAEPAPAPNMGPALLEIHTTTGKKAKPVPGVRIIIFKPDGDREILLKIVSTDKDGHTPPLSLTAAEASYSLHSGSPSPSLFTIETSVPKYCHTRHTHVPLYGGVASVLEIELTPLAEGEDGKELVYDHALLPN